MLKLELDLHIESCLKLCSHLDLDERGTAEIAGVEGSEEVNLMKINFLELEIFIPERKKIGSKE